VSLAVRAAAVVGLGALAVHSFVSAGNSPEELFGGWLYNGLQLLATVTLLLGAMRARGAERLGFVVLAIGLAASAAGDFYYTLALSESATSPSPADVGYVLFYVAGYIGLVLLLRARTRGLAANVWLDGAIAATGVASVAVAVLLGSIVDLTEGPVATVAVNLVYPLGDAMLFAAVVGVFVLGGRRLDHGS
jgi:hypothetical protein